MVVDTEMEVIAPQHTPMVAVLMWSARLELLISRKKAPAVGAINATIEAGLDIAYLVLDKSNQTDQNLQPYMLRVYIYIIEARYLCIVISTSKLMFKVRFALEYINRPTQIYAHCSTFVLNTCRRCTTKCLKVILSFFP